MADRFQTLPNGDVYDTIGKKIVKKAETPKVETPKADTPKEEPKKAKASKMVEEKTNAAKSHTKIARKILELNRTNPINKSDPKQLWERGYWYFEESEAEGVTPTPQGLVNAWGFKAHEQNLLLSGNSGLNAECRAVISEFKQALEQVAEGSLVDSPSGVVGKIFDLKNRFGWRDEGNAQVDTTKAIGEAKTKEELQKALAQMPGLDLIDKPMVVDAEFEVVEDGE